MKKHTRFLSLLLSATLLFGALLTGCEGSADDDGDDADTYTRTITFNANDGTASPATTTQSFTVTSESWSTSVTLNANTFTRSGYTFQGWAKSATSKTADYKDKATATFSNDTTASNYRDFANDIQFDEARKMAAKRDGKGLCRLG